MMATIPNGICPFPCYSPTPKIFHALAACGATEPPEFASLLSFEDHPALPDRAEVAAHGADLLVAGLRRGPVGPGLVGVDGQVEHPLPVEVLAARLISLSQFMAPGSPLATSAAWAAIRAAMIPSFMSFMSGSRRCSAGVT